MREFQSHWQTKLNETSEKLALLQTQIQQLKALRKNKSAELQTFIFQQYQFLNINGQYKNLAELFQETESKIPLAGRATALPSNYYIMPLSMVINL